MKRYTAELLSEQTGLMLVGATLQVVVPGTTTRISVYAGDDPSGPTVPQPIANGVAFFVPDGRYDLLATGPRGTKRIPQVDMFDGFEQNRRLEAVENGEPGAMGSLRADLLSSTGATRVRSRRPDIGAVDLPQQSINDETLSVTRFGAAGDNATDDAAAIQRALNVASLVGATVVFPAGIYRISAPLNVGPAIISNWAPMLTRTDQGNYDTMYTPYFSVPTYNASKNLRPVSIYFDGDVVLVPTYLPATPTPVLSYNLPDIRGKARIEGRCVVAVPSRISGGQYRGYDGLDDPIVTNQHIGFATAVPTLSHISGFTFGGLKCGMLTWGAFWTQVFGNRADNCDTAFSMAVANAINFMGNEAWYCNRGLVYDGGASVLQIHTEQVADDVVLLASEADCLLSSYLEDVSPADGTEHFTLSLGAAANVARIQGLVVIGLRIGSARPNKKAVRMYGAAGGVKFLGPRSYVTGAVCDTMSAGSIEMGNLVFEALLPPRQFPTVNGPRGRQVLFGPADFYACTDAFNQILPAVPGGSIVPPNGGELTVALDLNKPIPLTFVDFEARVRLRANGDQRIQTKVIGLTTTKATLHFFNATATPLDMSGAIHSIFGRSYDNLT